MATRRAYIEKIRRQIYNGQPSSDATITVNLVNLYLNEGIALAAKKNYIDNAQLDGIAYVNGSFYLTYKNLSIVRDEAFLFRVDLPHSPFAIGNDEGISTMVLTDSVQNTYPIVWINENQRSYQRGMRPVQNKLIGYSEGGSVYLMSAIPLTTMTAKATMVSGGDSSDLNSTLNVPDDYLPIVAEYVMKQLMIEKQMPIDAANDGLDGGRIE